NLVMYDQHIAQASINTIVPDLASEWSWDEDKTGLTFKLRQGVKWHDGKPFTAKDVKCTWDLLQGKSTDKLRLNPRKAWYRNLEEVVVLPAGADAEGHQQPGRPGPVSHGSDKRVAQRHHQSRGQAVRQPRTAARDRADPRPTGLYRHADPGQGHHRGRLDVAALWRLGDAVGSGANPARLWSRCRSEPRRGSQDHGKARLRREQPAAHQSVDPQHPALSRSGGDPDRPVEGNLYRRRARADRHRRVVSAAREKGFRDRPQFDRQRSR